MINNHNTSFNNNRILFLLSIGLILLSLETIIIQKTHTPPTKQEIQKEKQTQTTESIPGISYLENGEIDTSDWLTYRNEEYGFEFKYPMRWRMKEINGSSTNLIGGINQETSLAYLVNSHSAYISIGISTTTLDTETLIDAISSLSLFTKGEIIGVTPIKIKKGIIFRHGTDIGIDEQEWIFSIKKGTLIFTIKEKIDSETMNILQTINFY